MGGSTAQGSDWSNSSPLIHYSGNDLRELRQVEHVPGWRHSEGLPSLGLLTQLTSLQARFRVYGKVAPVFPSDTSQLFDLAHVFAGGLVEFTSDQHFGVGSNLILPGRGKDMGDGWETKRSRQPGHKDWVVIKL